jgi:hypothetical protein
MSKERDIEEMLRLTRRELLRYGVYGAGMIMAGGLASRALGVPQLLKPTGKVKAKAVIQIWLWGGASHLDTFDPKPGAGPDYTGPLTSSIKTNADGMVISELLPEMAKQADKYSIVRSMTHGSNAHETASYMVQTGFKSGDGIVHPGLGAVATLFKGYEAGYKGLIPPYIVLTQLLGRFSESGFLGFKAAPFATGGDPNQARFAVEGVVAEGITDERQRNRRELLQKLDTLRAELKGDPQIEAFNQAEAQAYDLILGDAGKVFDLSTEKEDLRTKYGKNTFGQSCLMARRLVEKGVPFVTVNYGGWDSHKQNFQVMRRKVPELDKGVATLLQDLSERGLLDSTVVWVGTEFGRTPKVQWEEPWGGGRSHYGAVFSHVVAGGGFKGGHIVGASDAKGEQVKDRPVYPNDLLASIYELIGIDPATPIPHPQGLSVRAVPATWEGSQSKGRLSEIM